MPIAWEDTGGRSSFAPEEIPSTWADVMEAQQASAFVDLPEMAVSRMVQLGRAQSTGERLTKDQADEKLKAAGLVGELTIDPEGTTADALDILMERKREELKISDTLARAEGGFGQTAARLGVALATGLASPTNVASAFIPVVPGSRYLKSLAEAAGPLARTGVRAGVGAIEGAAGTAVVEPIIYSAHQQEQSDFTMGDALRDVAFGSLFGGGLHTLTGGFGEAYRAARGLDQPWKGFAGLTVDDINLVRALRAEVASGGMKASSVATALDTWSPEARAAYLGSPTAERGVAAEHFALETKLAADEHLAKLDPAEADNLRAVYRQATTLKPAFDNALDRIAESVGGRAVKPELKTTARAVEKIVNDYAGDATRVKDVLRGTIAVDDVASARRAADTIRQNFTLLAGERNLLTEEAHPADGYRDAKFNVRLADGTIAEIQVNLPEMIKVKDTPEVHALYERRQKIEAALTTRDLTDEEVAEIAGLNRQMKERYDAAWNEARSRSKSASETSAPLRLTESIENRLGSVESNATQAAPPSLNEPKTTGVPSTLKNVADLSGLPSRESIGLTSDAIVSQRALDRTGDQALDRITSSELVDAASPEVREAALKTALNQSLNGEPVDVEALFAGERGRATDGTDSATLLPQHFDVEAWRGKAAELSQAIDRRLGQVGNPALREVPLDQRGELAALSAQREAVAALGRGEALSTGQRELVRQAAVGRLIADGVPVPAGALTGATASVWREGAALRSRTALAAAVKRSPDAQTLADAERSQEVTTENAAFKDDVAALEQEVKLVEGELKAHGIEPDADLETAARNAKQLESWARAAELAVACLDRGF